MVASMLSRMASHMAAFVILTFSGCSSQGSMPATWYAVHGDANNTDYSAVRAPRKVRLAWQRKFDGNINVGPTHDAMGNVYVTTNAEGCHLYALDQVTGETIWCSSEVNRFAAASAALIDQQGHVFIADNTHMFAFDNSGKLIWKSSIIGFPFSAQFTSSGRLIFITHIGMLYVMDRATGENVLTPTPLITESGLDTSAFDPIACMRGTEACPCANSLAIDQRSGRFYFTFWQPGAARADIVAMRYSETSSPRISGVWRNASLPGGSASSPDISFDGKRIYVYDNKGGLHALDAATGRNIWQFDIGYVTGGSQSTSPDGTILPAGGSDAPLICIRDMGDAPRLLWRMDSVTNRGIPTQTAGGLIFATLADKKKGRFFNRLVIIEARSGKKIDEDELPGTTVFTVGTTISPKGNIYIPSFNGWLFAFSNDDQPGGCC